MPAMGIFQRLLGREPKEERGEARAGLSKDDALAAYIVREYKSGRSLDDILDDPYLKNRASDEQRRRLLERPDVIRAIGEDTAAMARDRV